MRAFAHIESKKHIEGVAAAAAVAKSVVLHVVLYSHVVALVAARIFIYILGGYSPGGGPAPSLHIGPPVHSSNVSIYMYICILNIQCEREGEREILKKKNLCISALNILSGADSAWKLTCPLLVREDPYRAVLCSIHVISSLYRIDTSIV